MRRTRWTASVMGATLLLAACGGGGGDESASADQPLIVVETSADVEPVDASEDTSAAGSGGDTGAASASSEEDQAIAFAECMNEEGVEWPDPVVEADGSVSFFNADEPPQLGDGGALNEALETCSPLVEGASFLPSDDDLTELEDGLLKVTECLREQGVDVEDPDLSGGAAAGPNLLGGFDPTDPANAEVMEACSDVIESLNVPGVGG